MTKSHPALVFNKVTVQYPGRDIPALNELSLEIAAGERVALLGLNGSGKTTMLMAAVGLIPFEGSIEVDGIELTPKTVDKVRERIGFLFAVPADQLLFPKVVDDVAFSLVRKGIAKDEARQQAQLALDAFDAGHLGNLSPFELSHGQKARVALSGAMIAEPSVLLLDEPSAGLDPPGRQRLIKSMISRPVAFVAATHDLEFARRACHRAVLLDKGRLVDKNVMIDELASKWDQ